MSNNIRKNYNIIKDIATPILGGIAIICVMLLVKFAPLITKLTLLEVIIFASFIWSITHFYKRKHKKNYVFIYKIGIITLMVTTFVAYFQFFGPDAEFFIDNDNNLKFIDTGNIPRYIIRTLLVLPYAAIIALTIDN